MRRGTLIRSKRNYLNRLAKFIKLSINNNWSKKHLASLIYWRITRNGFNRH
jgi:hypothetical protein